MIRSVRSSRDSDMSAITEIYRSAVETGTASFELFPPDQAAMARRRATLVDAGYPYLVAEIDGRVAGYAYAGPYRPRPAYRFSVENSVYIADWARRRGLGQALLGALITQSEARGFRQMIAIIGDSRHQASVGLHRALGFTLVGTIMDVGYKFDQWLDTVIMQRALGPGATQPPGPRPDLPAGSPAAA